MVDLPTTEIIEPEFHSSLFVQILNYFSFTNLIEIDLLGISNPVREDLKIGCILKGNC